MTMVIFCAVPSSADDGTAQNITIVITGTNDVPVFTSNSFGTTYNDTPSTDTFNNSIGFFSATDVDGDALTYRIQDGKQSVLTKTGTYGTLILDGISGAYTYTPNSTTINALTNAKSEAYTITVSDGTLSASTSYTVTLNGVRDTTTPLVLDLNYDGVQTLGIESGIEYDITGFGLRTTVAWSSPEDGFLVRDINNDGLINDGTEMFGEATVLVNGSRARDGFEALADLDANQDGTIDSWDDAFSSLKIWRDANSDGITDAGELLTLTEHEIVSLNLAYRESDRVDNGNELRLVSDYTKTDGHPF